MAKPPMVLDFDDVRTLHDAPITAIDIGGAKLAV